MATKPTVLTFDAALAKAQGAKKILLTGTGFSIACMSEIFSYDALHARANFGKLSRKGKRIFDALGTKDFEAVMRALGAAATLLETYSADKKLCAKLRADAEVLRDILAETIAANHPDNPYKVTPEQYLACRKFPRNFSSIYTTNYDLLLYWALMRDDTGVPLGTVDDGFRAPDSPDEAFVEWRVENTDAQNVFYLQGALHLFDAGADLRQFTWSRTGVLLVDQIRAALADSMFPLIVAEGESTEKRARINHSGYLNRCYRSLWNTQNPLFVFGLALSENDDHILGAIKNAKRKQTFISLFGDPGSAANRATVRRAQALAAERDEDAPLEVHFFEAASARVWG